HNIPVVLYGSRVSMLGGEMKFTHIFYFNEPGAIPPGWNPLFWDGKGATIQWLFQEKTYLFLMTPLQLIDYQ
ncbi:MAG: hypothetical protein K2X26_14105, partial [Chitinophagaceae bacterium]|nr:hypothetical protein [Chitinophagaceae bacterium]